MFALQDRSQDGEKPSEAPNEGDNAKEDIVRHLPIPHNAEPRVKSDGQDEECRGDIANVNEETLTEAPIGVAINLATLQPVPANDEAASLHQVSQGEVVDEDYVLVVADEGAVVLAPSDHAVADEAEEADRRED